VDFPASSPFATGVGGTMLALNPDNTIALQAGWGNNLTRIAQSAALGNAPANPPSASRISGRSWRRAEPDFCAALVPERPERPRQHTAGP
jgi:hypothetical protein